MQVTSEGGEADCAGRFDEHTLGGGVFFSDPVGTLLLDHIGVDQVMFETDYPHESGTWPHTAEVVRAELNHLDEAARTKVLRDNAIRLFDLPFDLA